MPTFKEAMDSLTRAKGRREVYQHLSDHLNTNFISNGKPAFKVLVDASKVKIEESLIEVIVQELTGAIAALNIEISNIEGAQLASASPAVPQSAQQGEAKS